MADLRIVDAPLLSTVKGTEKIPTGGEGNFSISVNQVADFAKLKWFLATEGYVDNAVNGVRDELVTHVNDINNPHQVTKDQIGLGNVDNTADVDKPIGSATQAALTTLNQTKADKTYVDSQLNNKADKTTTYTKTETDSLVSVKSDTSYVNIKYSSHIKTFLNTGTALSNTVNGEYFFVISNDSEKVEDLYLNVNGVATNQNKSELSSLLQHNSILGRDVTGAHQATSISTASGVNQQQINDFGGAKWYSKVGGYALGATVKLANGDIVKSTVAANAVNPNIDMSDWVSVGNKFIVTSIAKLIAIQNPRTGDLASALSFNEPIYPLSKPYSGGGRFVFDETQVMINDGVVCFNGWVRQLESNKITTAMSGFTDNSANAVNSIRKCLAYLKTIGGGELELTDGLYILDNDSIIKDPTPNVSAYRYWFEPVSNVTITGTRNAILKVDDNVVVEDALYQYAKGYQVFLDLLVTENKNFKLKGFTFDGNALNNLLIPFSDNPFGNQSQCLFVSFSQCDGFEADDLGLSKTSGHQVFRFSINCKGHDVHHCDFSENGNINGNINLTDHSSIYNEGADFSFYHNKFINATFDTVSTAIETHGRNGVVFGNHFKNYNLGVLRSASVSDSHNVIVYGNTGEGLSQGFLFDSANGFKLKVLNFGNIFYMRKTSESGGRGVYGINVGGSAFSSNTGEHEITTFDNKFYAQDAESLAILGGKVEYFESRNEFNGFGRYYEHGVRSPTPTTKVVLKDKIKNLASAANYLVAVRNFDGQIANYVNEFDIDVQELSGSPSINSIVSSDEVSAIITGKINGVFSQTLLPYRGSWNTNTLFANIQSSVFVRDGYTLPPELTLEIKTPFADYQKHIGGSLTSIRRMSSIPMVAQLGGDYVGDIVYNTAPILGGHIGWVAVADVDFVVWKPFGAINA